MAASPQRQKETAQQREAELVSDERTEWLAENPDQADDFKPVDECNEKELEAELNSEQYRSAGSA